MKTDSDLDRQLRSTLRDELDHEFGPDPTWDESPAARRVAERERHARYRWPLRILSVAALIGTIGGVSLLGQQPQVAEYPAGGWIAFSMRQAGGDPSTPQDDDIDIWLAALDREPRRAVGSDTDEIRQLCPAFSPDGRRMAYGQVEGRASGLVVADVSGDGQVSELQTIEVGDRLPAPCPLWSPDGTQVAFGVNLTSPINPTRSGIGSAVWIVTLADRSTVVLPDLLATDLEWSPDGSLLAIVGGVETAWGDGVIDGLQDARIHLYAPSSGETRTLDETLGVGSLTWSPDARTIAFTGPGGIHLMDVDTRREQVIPGRYAANHGIGIAWSPDGGSIVYQRLQTDSGERHDVVLLNLGDPSLETVVPTEVMIPMVLLAAGATGSDVPLYPYRVTWSADGAHLLSVAWGNPGTGQEVRYLVAVPTNPGLPPVVLSHSDSLSPEDIVTWDGYSDTTYVPIQTWERPPD